MKAYTAQPGERKGKFQLLDDGTLGYASIPDIFSRGTHNQPVPREYSPYLSPYNLPPYFDNVTHVDWFRATARGSDVLHTIEELIGLLTVGDDGQPDTDLDFKHVDKGLHGYTKQYLIRVQTDKGVIAVGSIAYEDDPQSPMCGVMLDLNGTGMDYLRLNCPHKIIPLKELLSGYGFRISRVDIALDLPGEYCRQNSITVPVVLASHLDDRIFDPVSGSRSMIPAQLGDWSWAMAGRSESVPYQKYNPATMSTRGITVNVGSRKCANFFRVYEKSKQIIATAELGDDHDLDKWAVRIEQEIKHQKHLPPISWEVLTHPDYFFALHRPVRDYLTAYRSTLTSEIIREIDRVRYEQHKQLLIKKKAFWGKRSYGRLIRTLLDEGLSEVEVCDLLVREKGLKDYVYDMADIGDNPVLDIDPLTGYEELPTSPMAQHLRDEYGLWQDFPHPVAP